jgi:hypothetical protein
MSNKIASALLREVPIAHLNRFLSEFGGNPKAIGDACGNGCGSGCGSGCIDGGGLIFDRFGHAEISKTELEQAKKNIAGLKESFAKEVSRFLK